MMAQRAGETFPGPSLCRFTAVLQVSVNSGLSSGQILTNGKPNKASQKAQGPGGEVADLESPSLQLAHSAEVQNGGIIFFAVHSHLFITPFRFHQILESVAVASGCSLWPAPFQLDVLPLRLDWTGPVALPLSLHGSYQLGRAIVPQREQFPAAASNQLCPLAHLLSGSPGG